MRLTELLHGLACPKATFEPGRTLLLAGLGMALIGSVTLMVPFPPAEAAAVQAITGTASLSSVVCPSSTTCLAVGTNSITAGGVGVVVAINPATGQVASGQSVQAIAGTASLHSVVCPSSTSCLAVGSNSSGVGVAVPINPATDQVTSGQSVQTIAGAEALLGVACSSTTDCLAVGGVAIAPLDAATGAVLSGQSVQNQGVENYYGVACASTTMCFGVGDDTNTEFGALEAVVSPLNPATGNPVSGQENQFISNIDSLEGVTCVSLTLCVAVGIDGAASFDPTEALQTPLDPWIADTWRYSSSGVLDLKDVVCPSVTLCIAVASGGEGTQMSLDLNGLLLSAGSTVYFTGSTGLEGLACPSALCVGVGYYSTGLDESTGVAVPLSSETILLSPTALPSGTFNALYPTTTISASGGTAPYRFAVTSGSLPPGLTLASDGSLSGTPTQAGVFIFTVQATDSANLPNTATQTYSLTIDQALPTVVASTIPSSTTFGQSVSYSVTVSSPAGTPTGTVTFYSAATNLCTTPALSSGSGSCNATNAPVGSDTITAIYSGDTNFTGTSGSTPLSVGKALPTVAASTIPTSTTFGQSVSYSVTVSSPAGTPTGTVTFTNGATTLCTTGALVGGSATCSASDAPVGTDTITAAFSGDSDFAASDGTTNISVSAPPAPAPPPPPLPPSPPPPTHGYWLVGSDGGIFTFGSAQFHGSTGSLQLQRPVVGIVPTADHGGYWLDASDGGVFSFGDTQFYGSIPGLGLHPAGSGLPNSLNAPIVGMVPSNDDRGYFMVASDGGVFAFGDAHFAGSCPGIGGCSGAAVAVMPDASGNGYWLVTSTGNVYTFGDAPNFGAPGHGTVTSAVATPDGKGYWVLLSDGEVFPYGDAANLGSPSSANFNGLDASTAIFATSDGAGYWVSSALGAVFNYGDAPNDGGMSGTHLNGSIIAATGF
jgi:Bacterial Ig-like domain (group 3)/Putative Ig domain